MPGFREVGFQFEGLFVLNDGLLSVSLFEIYITEDVMSFRYVRVNRQGLFAVSSRLIVSSQLRQNLTKIVLTGFAAVG